MRSYQSPKQRPRLAVSLAFVFVCTAASGGDRFNNPGIKVTVPAWILASGQSQSTRRKDHPDRDAQFEYIAKRVKAYRHGGRPAVSVTRTQLRKNS